MLSGIDFVSEKDLLQWIRHSIETRTNLLSSGNQGHVYLYQGGGRRLVIKAPHEGVLRQFALGVMLRNEHRAYGRLVGVPGVPRCFGLLDNRYLVLEFLAGVPIFRAEIHDRPAFHDRLFNLIQQFHAAGVAHTDLRKGDNILVLGGEIPCVVDFGVAVVRKPGFAPLNHYLYRIARQFDYNAWIKLKYKGRFEQMTETDRGYYHRTIFERVAAWLKSTYRTLGLGRRRGKSARRMGGGPARNR